MGKLKRPKWGALSAERKAHIHKLNRVRNSAGKVKQWLIDNGHKPERERKKMMRQFLEALGIYKEGIGINLQIEALYKDDKFTIIGRHNHVLQHARVACSKGANASRVR